MYTFVLFFGMIIDTKFKYSSKKILAALIKEGVQGLTLGYVNLNELPVFKKKLHIKIMVIK